MAFIQKIRSISTLKFAFGKSNEFAPVFNQEVGAISMYSPNFGLDIPQTLSPENQIRGVFTSMYELDGIFLFNLSAVDLIQARRGFSSYEEASDLNMITEWELSLIQNNIHYLQMTIFHNGRNELKFTRFGIKIKWN